MSKNGTVLTGARRRAINRHLERVGQRELTGCTEETLATAFLNARSMRDASSTFAVVVSAASLSLAGFAVASAASTYLGVAAALLLVAVALLMPIFARLNLTTLFAETALRIVEHRIELVGVRPEGGAAPARRRRCLLVRR